jgi:MFS family permease
VHLCIGQAYALSVFNLPMTKLIGITASAPDDWKLTELGWIFSIAIFFLGVSSAVFGRWVEEGGPRKAMFTAACCWAGGFFLSAIGVYTHTLWLIYIGYGVLGGCGLGIGYISPVSTLIKWFPDRPGMATGMAIMGFGGGAFIASPLSVWLLGKFTTATHIGVAETFITLGCVYFIFMVVGSIIVRVPPPGWSPAGWTPPAHVQSASDAGSVPVQVAWKTAQFWLMWGVLMLNVTAGIGVLSIASPMIQEIFRGRVSASAAAGFTGLLSLFNIGGRIFWASLSDYVGRKITYTIFFVLGMILYAFAPSIGAAGMLPLFVLVFGIILTMYGGGFATIPAYLADRFGVGNVSAIHGRLLTAWSTAGFVGPMLMAYIRQVQIDRGIAASNAYTFTMYTLVGLLAVGLLCNLAIRPVPARLFTLKPEIKAVPVHRTAAAPPSGRNVLVAVTWAFVLVPIAWGVFRTFTLASRMFQ